MPPVSTKITLSDGHFLIWRLDEPLTQLLDLLPEGTDTGELRTISHPQKQREWLASRIALQSLCLKAGIPYQGIYKDPHGKPYLTGASVEISMSHSVDYVAVALRYTGRIGIDLERPGEKLLRVAAKFLQPQEIAHSRNDIRLLCHYWCAKEAAFKWYGQKGTSFLHHIRIEPFPDEATTLVACLQNGSEHFRVSARLYWMGGYCLALAY